MALTQISTGGVKDDAVTAGKIPANAVGSSEIADDAVGAAQIAKPIDLADNEKVRLGTGNDTQLYHDGNHTYIYQDGTGELRANTATFRVMDRNGGATQILASENGSVELFHDNAKKFTTDADGFQLTGQASCYLDLYSYESSTATLRGALHANNSDQVGLVDSQLHWLVKGIKDGAVEIFYDNDRKIKTLSTGAQVESATGDCHFYVHAEEDNSGSDAIITARVTNTSASGYLMFGDADDVNIGKVRYMHSINSMLFYTNDVEAFRLNSVQNATFVGTVSDSKGEIRSIPKATKNANYTLAASDSGKCISMDGSSLTLTIPHNTMTAETATTILNNSANELTLAKGASMTLYNSADGSTPTKIAARGMATVYFEGQNTGYISGAGLS